MATVRHLGLVMCMLGTTHDVSFDVHVLSVKSVKRFGACELQEPTNETKEAE